MKFRYLLAGGLILTALFMVTPVMAQDIVVGDYVTTEIRIGDAAAAMEYWTDERMKNALPYPMPSPDNPGFDLSPEGPFLNQADGEPGFSSPPGVLWPEDSGGSPGTAGPVGSEGSPGTKSLGASGLASLQEPGDGGDTVDDPDLDYTWPFPFTMYEVHKHNNWQWPYTAIGRIFFTTASGSNSSCSGSSIGNRAVLTAGHCVSTGYGAWHRNFIYRPSYRQHEDGSITSKQIFWVSAPWTYTAWHSDHSYCRDVGFLITRDKSGGRTLQDIAGALRHAYNQDAEHLHWSQFGYPAEETRTSPNYYFNGSRMYQNNASFAEFTASWWGATDCSPLPVCIGSMMTGGSSGGPVVYKWDSGMGIYPGTGSSLYANGVNSTYFLSNRIAGGMCFPYFDTSVHNFILDMWAQ